MEYPNIINWNNPFLFKWMLGGIQKANSGDPDQMPHNAASGLGLHCLAMSHKKVAMLI